MNYVTIFSAVNTAQVQVIRSRLEAANFHPFLPDDLSVFGSDPLALGEGGIRVQVPEDEAAEARAFLEG